MTPIVFAVVYIGSSPDEPPPSGEVEVAANAAPSLAPKMGNNQTISTDLLRMASGSSRHFTLRLTVVLAGGALAVVLIGFSSAELFTNTSSSPTVKGLSAAGIVTALLAITLAAFGIYKRSKLVDEFRNSALDLSAEIAELDRSLEVDEKGEWASGEVLPNARRELINKIEEYESALREIGAVTEASQVAALVRSLRNPRLFGLDEVRRLLANAALPGRPE